MIHTVFPLNVSEEMNTYIPGGGHFEFYARWPPEIDHNLFAMVFETFTPIPNTMPNLKNLAPSARFDLFLVYSCPAMSLRREMTELLNTTKTAIEANHEQKMTTIRGREQEIIDNLSANQSSLSNLRSRQRVG